MIERFEIQPSTAQSNFLISVYLLTGVVLLGTIDSVPFSFAGFTLTLLLGVREFRSLRREERINLILNSSTASIELEQYGQSHFYDKYKVYQTRWFAILKLIDNRKNRSLLLSPDRFNSLQNYRDFCYSLRKAEDAIDAD